MSDATELAMKPPPEIVVEKIPNGIWPPVPTAVMVGLGGTSEIDALAVPPNPVTLTVSESEAGNAAGAVYRPVLLTVP